MRLDFLLLGTIFSYTHAQPGWDYNWGWDDAPFDAPDSFFIYPRHSSTTFLERSDVNISWRTTFKWTVIEVHQGGLTVESVVGPGM
jgi:hypothetical protein